MTRLGKGEVLRKNQELRSENGKFTAKINNDGYFTVYYLGYSLWRYPTAVNRLEMQADGNMMIYDSKNNTFKISNTSGRGDYVVVDYDGSLTVYDANNNYIWYEGFILGKS